MYDRAPRNVGHIITQTPHHVGPGTYEIGRKHNQIESYAPFTSLAPRVDIFSNITDGPGPGQYDLRPNQTAIKGGSTLCNRETRFKSNTEDGPGPGTYLSDIIETKIKARSISELRPRRPKIDIQRKLKAPSIQDPKNAYGYEENSFGELVPQNPPQRDQTLGPAFYNINVSKSSYKGIHFSKYSSNRTNFAAKPGPGPGDYDVADPIRIDVLHYNIKQNEKKNDLTIPRYPEVAIKTAEKEGIPGPGKYDQKRLFDTVNNKVSEGLVECERPPFGVQAKRFTSFKTTIPGPGAYNDQRTSLNALTKIKSLKNTPFSQSSVRFDQSLEVRSAPGPGQYKILGFADENLRKVLIGGARKPGFGQSSMRNLSLSKRDDYYTPGPAQYQIKEKPFKLKHENFSSNFASSSKRENQVEDTPGPTAYNVSDAYENLVKVKREKPRNKNAQKRQESFNVASKRIFKLATDEEIPGPGAYDVDLLKSKGTHFAMLYDKRWKSVKERLPGPADYELAPIFQDTVLKGTFNTTLQNPFYKDINAKVVVINQGPELLKVS